MIDKEPHISIASPIKTILFIHDQTGYLRDLQEYLPDYLPNCRVITANAESFSRALDDITVPLDLIITDSSISCGKKGVDDCIDGADIIANIRAGKHPHVYPDIPSIIVSGMHQGKDLNLYHHDRHVYLADVDQLLTSPFADERAEKLIETISYILDGRDVPKPITSVDAIERSERLLHDLQNQWVENGSNYAHNDTHHVRRLQRRSLGGDVIYPRTSKDI